jgi:hypothetical protein
LKSETVPKNNREFILLYDNENTAVKLRSFLNNLEETEFLYHFCCYADNKNFFLYVKPVKQKLEVLFKSVRANLGQFYKGEIKIA